MLAAPLNPHCCLVLSLQAHFCIDRFAILLSQVLKPPQTPVHPPQPCPTPLQPLPPPSDAKFMSSHQMCVTMRWSCTAGEGRGLSLLITSGVISVFVPAA